MADLTDRVVLVTGAGGNLGRAVAGAFLAAGSRMVLVDHDQRRLRQIYADLASNSVHHLASADLNDTTSVQSLMDQVIARFGRVDALVNTVGGFKAGSPVHETELETWDEMMSLNARTAFIVCRAVVPQMLRQGSGRIVNIGARPGLAGKATMAAYSASKSALMRLTESLSAELRDSGINVNCVVPGTLDTPQNREAMKKADVGRWVSPTSLADVILFLASDAARDIHGAILPVYGRS